MALAYLVPPVTGFWAFVRGADVRTKAHGFQSIVLGTLWPLGLYLGSWITPGATQAVFVVFVALWLALMLSTASGRGPVSPGLVRRLEEARATGEG